MASTDLDNMKWAAMTAIKANMALIGPSLRGFAGEARETARRVQRFQSEWGLYRPAGSINA